MGFLASLFPFELAEGNGEQSGLVDPSHPGDEVANGCMVLELTRTLVQESRLE